MKKKKRPKHVTAAASKISSNASELSWTYESYTPMGGASGQAYTNTLAASGMPPASVLAREAIQNSVDARKDTNLKVRVEFAAKSLEGDAKASFVKAAGLAVLLSRKEKLGLKEPNCIEELNDKSVPLSLLYIDDYNTTGLEGDPQSPDSKFFRLLLSLGDGGKEDEHGTGGSYGFGKSVYSSNSGIQTIFAYSRTVDAKGQPMSILFGCGYFRKHRMANKPFTGRVWFGIDKTGSGANAQQVVVPLRDADADTKALTLGFKKRAPHELGTSILIIDSLIDGRELLKGIEDWWWPRLISSMLDVAVAATDGSVSFPRPRKRTDLKPFFDAFEIAMGTSAADSKTSFKKTLNRVEKDNVGTVGLVVLKQTEDEQFPVDEDRIDSVALIRSTHMVVSYHRKWSEGSPAMVGAFIAHDDIDDTLRASEPPAHNDWDRGARRLQDVSGHMRLVVDRVLSGIRRFLKETQKAASPPPPTRPKRLVLLEKTLASLLSATKKGGGGNGGGEAYAAPIHLAYEKEPMAEADGEHLRLTAVFSVRLKADEDVDELKARLRVTCPVVEDNELGDSLHVKIATTEKIEDDSEKAGWKRLTIRRDRPARIMCETESYNPLWTVKFVPEIEPVEV